MTSEERKEAFKVAKDIIASEFPETQHLFSVEHKRSWPEDGFHENGNYQCQCSTCGHLFLGHKRRTVCKVCSDK